MLREEVQMSAKEVWSKYRLALPVFLCLAVAGFIIAMLLRAGRSAEPPMYAVDSSDFRSRPSSQTATRSSTGSRPPNRGERNNRRKAERRDRQAGYPVLPDGENDDTSYIPHHNG